MEDLTGKQQEGVINRFEHLAQIAQIAGQIYDRVLYIHAVENG